MYICGHCGMKWLLCAVLRTPETSLLPCVLPAPAFPGLLGLMVGVQAQRLTTLASALTGLPANRPALHTACSWASSARSMCT